MPARTITLLTERFPEVGLDTGVSHALALEVGEGRRGETFRIHPAEAIVAFGRQDVVSPGYGAAVAAARRHGFEAVERLAGGRAAVFHPGTLAFSWAIPAVDPRQGIHERFARLAQIMADAFGDLGVDARIGEVPGEYCPGAYSVSIGGRYKVMGVGQRLVRGAAHVGGVVVVSDAGQIRSVLEPVYAELGLGWDPGTVGALDQATAAVTLESVTRAILDRLSAHAPIVEGTLDEAVVRRGRDLAPRHVSPVPPTAG